MDITELHKKMIERVNLFEKEYWHSNGKGSGAVFEKLEKTEADEILLHDLVALGYLNIERIKIPIYHGVIIINYIYQDLYNLTDLGIITLQSYKDEVSRKQFDNDINSRVANANELSAKEAVKSNIIAAKSHNLSVLALVISAVSVIFSLVFGIISITL